MDDDAIFRVRAALHKDFLRGTPTEQLEQQLAHDVMYRLQGDKSVEPRIATIKKLLTERTANDQVPRIP